jgi:uncharacterized protein (DUF58 family)
MSTDHQYLDLLDPEAVNRASSLGLYARLVVEGAKVGEHRSPQKGFAIEFAQHREYGAGDDVRHLDWKAHAKTDRLFIKQYEQDTNFVLQILVDCTGSMNFSSGKLSKFDFARVLAATLSHLVLSQRDAVTLGFIGNGQPELLPLSDTPGRLPLILNALANARADGALSIAEDFKKLTTRLARRSITILISDLLQNEEDLLNLFPDVRYQNSELLVLHVMDDAELSFPYKGKTRFEGLEGEVPLTLTGGELAEAYREAVKAHSAKLQRACERHDVHYVLINSSNPLSESLSEYLTFRRRLQR